jgi:SAM-dependent methyltransferase
LTATSTCRACGSDLCPVLSLGRTPLANALLDEADLTTEEPTFPLDLAFCPSCSLAQITETVPPDSMFREYVYFSSFSETMVLHAAELAAQIRTERSLGPGSLVVEAASNDGYLLRNYRDAGIPVLGVEPARNIATTARTAGIPTLDEFFDAELAQRLADDNMRADVFHAHNVLAHVPDLNGFLTGVATVLKPDGVAVVEVPYVRDLIDECEFDTIYHEHLSYFSLTALERCFSVNGLTIWHVERHPIHGGSLRLFASRSDRGTEIDQTVPTTLAEEVEAGLTTIRPYAEFARRVERLRDELVRLLGELCANGHTIAAYGASAKGSTLLNFCGIGRETIDFVVDRSSAKEGRFTPGTHLRIWPPSKLLQARPDYTLLLTWNFADEILRQQAEYRAAGGRFIIPVPHPIVI